MKKIIVILTLTFSFYSQAGQDGTITKVSLRPGQDGTIVHHVLFLGYDNGSVSFSIERDGQREVHSLREVDLEQVPGLLEAIESSYQSEQPVTVIL